LSEFSFQWKQDFVGVQHSRLSKIINKWRLRHPIKGEQIMNLTTYLHLASQLRLREGLPLPWRRSGVSAAETDFTDVIWKWFIIISP